VNAQTTLDALLAALELTIRDAQAFQHEHRLASSRTRKLPGDMLRTLHRWQKVNDPAASADTLCEVVANGTGITRAASADKQVNVVCTEEPPVPAAHHVTSIRLPDELRERVEQYGREHRWSMGEVTRVALEQLVGSETEDDTQTERRQA